MATVAGTIDHREAFEGACPLRYPDDRYTATIEGERVVIPKTTRANLLWRRSLLEQAQHDLDLRHHLRWLTSRECADAVILWINLFGWTYVKQEVEDGGRQRAKGGRCIPWITWPVQDQTIRELEAAIGSHDLTIDKSRQMGATWLIGPGVFLCHTLMRPNRNFEVMSRVEELVDNPQDQRAIMWKMDFVLERLPEWLHPPVDRRKLRIAVPEHGSAIIGRSTSSEQGRGGAVDAVWIDEAAEIRFLKGLWVSYSESTQCRLINATPKGPGDYQQLVFDPNVRTARLPWWEHPDKGKGRRLAVDDKTGEVYITSPWFERRVERAGGDRKCREIAQELNMDHFAAGSMVFDAPVLYRLLSTVCRLPERRGKLVFIGEGQLELALQKGRSELFEFRDDDRGPLMVWTDLDPETTRPFQGTSYALAADVALGTGASNSVASGADVMTRRKVIEFASGIVDPGAFALMLAMLGYWLGGKHGCAFLSWEANGPGGIIGRRLRELAYPWRYQDVNENATDRKRAKSYGWVSTNQSKADLANYYRTELACDRFDNPSQPAIEEALAWVYFETGQGLGPGTLEKEGENARKTHGDRVIADMLCCHSLAYCAKVRPPAPRIPEGSPAWRRLQAKKKAGKNPWR